MKRRKGRRGIRPVSIGLCLFLGLGLVVGGWTMTGELAGLGAMLLGLVFLLTGLMLYNQIFQDPKQGR